MMDRELVIAKAACLAYRNDRKGLEEYMPRFTVVLEGLISDTLALEKEAADIAAETAENAQKSESFDAQTENDQKQVISGDRSENEPSAEQIAASVASPTVSKQSQVLTMQLTRAMSLIGRPCLYEFAEYLTTAFLGLESEKEAEVIEKLEEACREIDKEKAGNIKKEPGNNSSEKALAEGCELAFDSVTSKEELGLSIWLSQFSNPQNARTLCFFGSPESVYFSVLSESVSPDCMLMVFDPEGEETILDLKDELTQNLNYYLLEGMIVTCEPGTDVIFHEQYASFINEVVAARERIYVNKNTLARFKDSASKNVIVNLPMLREFNLVTDISKILPKDVPVIIVSAGPSLDKNIEELRRAKGHALIFAVDTAMKYLMAKNIMPDLAITVEPIKPMANYEDERCFTIPHIFDCESNPQIVGRCKARKFIINCRDYVKNLLEEMNIEVPEDTAGGGSVATSAFAVCYQLGIKRIILIGQDLAYLGDATHAGNVESKGINNTVEYTYIEGALGGKVRTRCDWLGYLKWFENSIKAMNEMGTGTEVIDATEGGALIKGTVIMTLSDAVDKFCSKADYDFKSELNKLPTTLKNEDFAQLDSLIKRSVSELDDVAKAAQEGTDICEEAIAYSETKQQEEAFVMAQRLRVKCEKALLFPLINNYAVSDIAEETSKILANDRTALGKLKQLKLAFGAVISGCEYFKKVFSEREE